MTSEQAAAVEMALSLLAEQFQVAVIVVQPDLKSMKIEKAYLGSCLSAWSLCANADQAFTEESETSVVPEEKEDQDDDAGDAWKKNKA